MAPGGEQGRQLPADQARSAGQGDDPARPRKAGVQFEVAARQCVAIVEQHGQLPGNAAAHQRLARLAQRERVFDAIDEPAAMGIDGLNPVTVAPALERPLELHVTELPAGDPVAVHGLPSDRQGPDPHPQRDPVAVVDGAAAAEDFHAHPRRAQPLERAGPLVPVERFGGRYGQLNAPLANLDRHGPLLRATSP